MNRSPTGRVLSAIWLVAFALSALQGVAVPKLMAATHDGTSAVSMKNMSDCSACDEQGMVGDSCTTVCSSAPALMPPVLVTTGALSPAGWSWTSQALTGRSLSPATSPPRS